MITCFKFSMLVFCFLIPANSLWADTLSGEGGQGSAPSLEMVRFGFVQTTLGSINENDAKAAISVWTNNIIEEMNLQVTPDITIYQADACLANLKGFEIMAELNPQLARQMKIVETSSPYIPVIFCFRKDYRSPIIQVMVNDFQSLAETAGGAQLLTIFQMDGMEQITIADLANVLSLLKEEHDILGPVKSGKAKGADN